MPASAEGAPLLSRLEPEIASEQFGVAVRMACADASAPYKLPLQDQLMFPDGDAALPVCLVQRYESRVEEDSDGRTAATKEDKSGGSGGGEAAAAPGDKSSSNTLGVNKDELVVASMSPPVSPVWVPALQPAFGPASTLPADSDPPPARIFPSRTAPVSPVTTVGYRVPRQARAVSSSPRIRDARASAGTLDAATAAAAVAAAVAAVVPTSTDDDLSRSASPVKPAGQRFGGFGRRGRSRSASPPGMKMAAAAALEAEAGDGAAEPAALRRDKSFKSLSPLKMKGRGFFSPSKSRWASSRMSPLKRRAAKEGSGILDSDAAADGDTTRTGDNGTEPAVEPENAENTGDGAGARSSSASGSNDGGDGDEPAGGKDGDAAADVRDSPRNAMPPPPPPPPTPPAQFFTPPTARRSGDNLVRKSPAASPARPPLKPMAAEQQQQQQQQPVDADPGKSGQARDGGGSSLLDGVEQSSDLGAFFRRGEGGQGGGRGRRGRRLSPRRRGVSPRVSGSPRARAGGRRRSPRRSGVPDDSVGGGGRKDDDDDEGAEREEESDDDDEEEEEEEENGRGAGVGVHVIVLHHGYCGSSMDMRLIKNYIRCDRRAVANC